MSTKPMSALTTLLSYYRQQRLLLAVDLSAVTLHAGVQVAIPFIALRVFTVYLPAGDLTATLWASLLFAIAVLLSGGLEWTYIQFGHWLGIRVEAAMRTAFFSHIQELPFEFFDRTKTGDVLSRITSDLMLVGETAHHLLEDFTEIILVLVGAFIVMFWINPVLASLTLIPIPFILVFAALFQKRIHSTLRTTRTHVSNISSHVENAVQGIREIKSFTRENREKQAFFLINTRFRRAFEHVYVWYAPLFAGTQVLLEGYSLLYIAVGAWMVVHNAATLPQVFVFFMYSRYVTQPLRRVVCGLDMYQQGFVGYRRFREFMAVPSEADPAAQEAPLTVVHGALSIRGLRFCYPGTTKDVLTIPELEIPAGATCAFVGPSGAGKSTLAALIPRFYEPTAGTFYLDGRDTAKIPKRSLRAAIGIVAQRPFLFDGTIRDNLLLGRSGASDEALFEALEQANLADFIATLPEGLSTPVGEHGLMLSGGQSQRVAIARVFLKNPPILILDEATSALDTFSEVAVQEALQRLSHGRTTLVIAHRLTTIRHASLICYLENGHILERGTHAELIAIGGRYHALLQAAGML
ncbi:MAG: ABC transporter ATP-binding protein [Kiritimatiellia bacterium]